MKKHRFLIVITLFITISCQGQVIDNCNSLLSKDIYPDAIVENSENFEKFGDDFEQLLQCKFDSIDYLIFLGENRDLTIVSFFLVDLPKHGSNKNNTFQDLYELILDYKKTEEYTSARNQMITSYILAVKVVKIESWKEDSVLLKNIGLTSDQLRKIRKLIESKKKWTVTYKEFFEQNQAVIFNEKKENN